MDRLSRLASRLRLALRILEGHWSQPATALWRLFEAEVVRARLQAEGRCLDLGCGDGTLAPLLVEGAGPAVWIGLDLDPREVRLAARTGAYRGVCAASAEGLPFPAGAFDLVLSNSALEHMDHLDWVLAEAAQALRPGGMLVFTVPSDQFHRRLLWPRLLRGLGLGRLAERYLRHLDRRLRHLRYPTPEEWTERLDRHGFRVRVLESYLSGAATAAWETLANLTGGLVHLARRGRGAPREAQLTAGLGGSRSRVLGALAFLLLLPALLWTAAESPPRAGAGLYAEAVREPPGSR